MKKLLIVLLLIVFITSPVFSSALTYTPNETSQITIYDFHAHELKLGFRYPALSWRGLVYFDGTLVTDFESVGIAGGLSLDLISVGKLLGLEVHLTRNVIFGFCGGYNFSLDVPIYGFYSGVKWSW
ncbi:unnamed protein product [marine sediment metagenome]|uniref:Uncharacterized protein n=1 Tax=marine sediment metagenome TaxID=412755 RepID=X1RRD4_9ZZZZ